MRKIILFFASICVLPIVAAEIPVDYYTSANGKSDSILKSTLSQIIRKHTVLSYGNGTNSSWECFYYSDRDTATNKCMDMYCDDWKEFTTPGAVVSGCNIEHSFAKSWWGGSTNDAYKDCFHLNPSNSTANSSRGNYPPAVPTQDFKSNTGSLKVGKATYNGQTFWVFEPKDEYKGDFARAYFYMATCYGDELTWRKDNTDVGSYYAMQNDNYLEFLPWLQEVLMTWHRQDPVSTKEINRANAVNNFQGNRNPFIDYPCLAEYIWGDKKGETVDFDQLLSSLDADFEIGVCDGCSAPYTEPTITAPKKDIEVGSAELAKTATKEITVKGALLTNPITLKITGKDAVAFSLSVTSVSAAEAMTGKSVTITYAPTSGETHMATLTLESVGAETVSVGLSAFVLHPFEVVLNVNYGTCAVGRLTETSLGSGVTLPEVTTPTGDWVFFGWCTAEVSETQLKPTTYAAGTLYKPTQNDTLYAVFKKGDNSGVATFDPANIDNLTAAGTLTWMETTSGVTLKLSAGQRYTNNTPYTFTVTNGTSNYFEINGDDKQLESITVTLSESKYAVNQVSAGTLTTNGTSQTITNIGLNSVKCYATSGNQIRATKIDVDYGTCFYSSFPTASGINTPEMFGSIVSFIKDNELYLVNLPEHASVTIYDIMGRNYEQRINCTTKEQFCLLNGIYAVQIVCAGQVQTIKVINF